MEANVTGGIPRSGCANRAEIIQDFHLLVVNKPAGMVVHPGHGNYSGTLINALIYHFDNLPQNSSERPGLVHRIDKDTS